MAGTDLERVRRVTSEALMEHFAAEHMALEEFERRLGAVRVAETVEELREVLADLPGRGGEAASPASADARAVLPGPADSGRMRSRADVVHRWSPRAAPGRMPARIVWALAPLGGARVDLSRAVLPAGTTEVRVVGALGSVEILVPSNVPVEVRFAGLGGGIDADGAGPPPGEADGADRPRIRVTGVGFLCHVLVRSEAP